MALGQAGKLPFFSGLGHEVSVNFMELPGGLRPVCIHTWPRGCPQLSPVQPSEVSSRRSLPASCVCSRWAGKRPAYLQGCVRTSPVNPRTRLCQCGFCSTVRPPFSFCPSFWGTWSPRCLLFFSAAGVDLAPVPPSFLLLGLACRRLASYLVPNFPPISGPPHVLDKWCCVARTGQGPRIGFEQSRVQPLPVDMQALLSRMRGR